MNINLKMPKLKFGKIKMDTVEDLENVEIDYEKMFYATDKIASVVNMKVNFTAEEEEAFRKGILVLLELQTYEKTRVK